MPKYNKNTLKKLQDHLYHGYDHDAELERISYDPVKEILKVETINLFYNVKADYTFYDIALVFYVKGDDDDYDESRKTINALVAKDDFSYLEAYVRKYRSSMSEAAYSHFQEQIRQNNASKEKKDLSYLQKQIEKYESRNIEDSLYLGFQMFSGDEIHVVSKEVMIEVIELGEIREQSST